MNKQNLFSFAIGIIFFACAGAALYPTYNLQLPLEGCYKDGKLLAHDPKDDLPLTICEPDATDKMKCVTIQSAVYKQQLIDESNCQQDLIACQKKCP